MELPHEIPVMVLPKVTLFPQTVLPLFIFEPRYRKMLAAVLDSHRTFCVTMRKPGRTREIPLRVAGLGLVRAAVRHRDGTAHLLLQGLARVELLETVRTRPYRVHRFRPLPTGSSDTAQVNKLVSRLRKLVEERLAQGNIFPAHSQPAGVSPSEAVHPVEEFMMEKLTEYLAEASDPGVVADLVACSLLREPAERQYLLETADLEKRLHLLNYFLQAEVVRRRQEHEE